MANGPSAQGKYLIVIAGPTAVGKTELSIRLARQFTTEILSADSRQFFKEITVGTAKPLPAEQQGVRHHFIDSHHITEEYSAGKFEQDALALLQQLYQIKNVVILTGGSGLYVRALCEGMDQMPEIAPSVRENLVRAGQEQGKEYLLSLLQQYDPVYFEQVDKANMQRVIRALEVSIGSGQPYSAFRCGKAAERPFQTIKIGLIRDRRELYGQIDRRVDLMLENGLLEEAKALYPYKAHNALQTVGYQEIFGYLEGQYDWDETRRLLKRNSRRYAKRQLTWFKKDPAFKWFHPDQWQEIVPFIEERVQN